MREGTLPKFRKKIQRSQVAAAAAAAAAGNREKESKRTPLWDLGGGEVGRVKSRSRH